MKEKILVIHQGALGDLVLSFPALVLLKHRKKASVALLCPSGSGKIARELNVVDGHFPLESARFCSLFSKDITAFVKEFICNHDTIILISFSAATEHHIRQNHAGRVHRISPRPPVDEETHVALHLIRQMEGYLQSQESKAGDVVSSCCDELVKQVQSRQENGFLVIHPGAGSPRKRWPVEDFIRVATIIKGMNLGKVVFLVGPAESDLAPIIRTRSKGRFRIYEVCDPSHLMALVRQARCFIGNDSGVTHLAAFMGIPTVAVFGPSSPKRWSPVGPATKVLRGVVDCAPCFEMATVNCEDPQCMHAVSVDMVVRAAEELALRGRFL